MPRAHLGHALASEWTKIRTVRSTMWTLGVMFLLVVGIGFLIAAASGGTTQVVLTPLLGDGLFGLLFGQICIITLGVLVVTSEYGTGMIRTTLTACPARGRVLLAKAIVFFLVAFVTTTVAAALTALIRVGMVDTRVLPDAYVSDELKDSVVGGELVASGGEWVSATVGAGLYVALLGLLALAIGALMRHSAGAITTMLGLVLLPPLIAVFMQSDDLKPVSDALLEFSPMNGLASMFGMPLQTELGMGAWTLLGLLAAVVAAALTGAYAALAKRDV